MKQILVVNASPRQGGNSDVVVETLQKGMQGAAVTVFPLREKQVLPCKACGACKKQQAILCSQKDDMAALLPRLEACDALVLVAPIYFNWLNGPAKIFIDRLFPFYHPGRPGMSLSEKRGKKAALIAVSGGPASLYEAQVGEIVRDFGIAGVDDSRTLFCGGVNLPGEISQKTELLREIDTLAGWLMAE